MKVFVGNLSYNVTEGDLRSTFEAFGQVASTTVIKDKQSGRSKGFGFVEMPEQAEARSAIAALNGQAFKGRTITVNEARPDTDDRRGKNRGGADDRRGKGRYWRGLILCWNPLEYLGMQRSRITKETSTFKYSQYWWYFYCPKKLTGETLWLPLNMDGSLHQSQMKSAGCIWFCHLIYSPPYNRKPTPLHRKIGHI